MFRKLRMFLAKLLIGHDSFMQNVNIQGSHIGLRNHAQINYNSFDSVNTFQIGKKVMTCDEFLKDVQ